ncbi:alpha-galactosidase [Brevundimonas nasdae]|uniref:Alpha-galactosidase n=2 Tax=Alphaproteobacteria TaxID=28211 RepID=A0ABX8TKS2_9CAUL|nr:alpha-galactosidase [Brevundimonas nasdae]QYC10652.1 alpha-galactosidase [Brevundimonas nasdae]QYC13439.1 alpha-galactosidase [Brevundimonas nasdae]
MTALPMNRRLVCLSMLGASAAWTTQASAFARYDSSTKVFRLDGGETTYAFGVNNQGQVQALYWGGRLADGDTPGTPISIRDHSSVDLSTSVTPQEFPAFGGGMFVEPALKVAFTDGARDLVLRYESHRITDQGITVRLKDINQAVYVELRYVMDAETGILGRSAVVENRTRKPIRIDQLAAAALNLPIEEDYQLHYLTGRWAAEWTLQSRPLTAGSTVLESRRGDTGHQNNPWFAIDRKGVSGEENGPVWFGALAWSGSWRITLDQDPLGVVRIVGGYNPFDFAYRLMPGDTLESPIFYAGYSGHGMGGASRLMHRFQRRAILPGGENAPLRPVLYNSWEATEFHVDEPGQVALAEKAATIGVERFVMDDGWFGARNNDRAGLGDWTVNRNKFPNGLKPLIDRVKGLGMDFGLWVEPEMVNADSDLYRAHPDWVLSMPGRPRTEGRNQMVLNLARRDVRDYLLKVLDDLVSQNDIAFLKWDHNRNWSEPGWDQRAVEDQQQVYVAFTKNLYWIITELRRRHPKLEIETCAGGGGRVDLGILTMTDQAWPSDNTDPYDRLTMQDGFSHAYAPSVMMAWVTDSPNWVNQRTTSLEYRFLSSMQGGLGVGANLNHWQDADFATAKRLIAEYKTIRRTVQRGDLYRLISPQKGSNRSVTLSVSPDKSQAALFAFVHSSTKLDPQSLIQLRGLDPRATYALRAYAGPQAAADATALNPVRASGAYWMEHGVDSPLRGDFQAAGFVLDRV